MLRMNLQLFSSTEEEKKLNGVDQATINKINSQFTTSNAYTDAQKETEKYKQKFDQISSKENIIDQNTWNTMNSQFAASNEYNQAMNFTNDLLKKLSSGKTSYTDQIDNLMGQIQNRDKFKYDVDSDTLFQQYLSSMMGSGKQAMQDTMGQASALTGGYGSTYATSAANQAYNAYIEDAYNNLPEYYQMALEAYQAEGQDLYDQLNMFNTADAKEYQRMYDSWNANFTNTQQMYEKEYGAWQDSVANAYNSANMQLQEHDQLYQQAYNAYSLAKNNETTLYSQEYQKWADEVANALSYASLANSDYWTQVNYEMSLASSSGSGGSGGSGRSSGSSKSSSSGVSLRKYQQSQQPELKTPTATQNKNALAAYNESGSAGLARYVDSLSGVDTDAVIDYALKYGTPPTAVTGAIKGIASSKKK